MTQVKAGGTGPFVDLKLLKPVEVEPQMKAYAQGLGVACAYCHMPADYATNEPPNKVVARQMIILTRDINAKYFGGAEMVTCYSCHQGAAVPKMKPAVD